MITRTLPLPIAKPITDCGTKGKRTRSTSGTSAMFGLPAVRLKYNVGLATFSAPVQPQTFATARLPSGDPRCPRCTWRTSRLTSSTLVMGLLPGRRPSCLGCPGRELHSVMANAAKGKPLHQWVAGYSTFLGTVESLSMRAQLTLSLLQVVGNGLCICQSKLSSRGSE